MEEPADDGQPRPGGEARDATDGVELEARIKEQIKELLEAGVRPEAIRITAAGGEYRFCPVTKRWERYE